MQHFSNWSSQFLLIIEKSRGNGGRGYVYEAYLPTSILTPNNTLGKLVNFCFSGSFLYNKDDKNSISFIRLLC